MRRFLAVLGIFSVLAPPAWAYVYFGNHPTVTIHVDRPAGDIVSADVHVDRIRMHQCAGGYTDYLIDADLDVATPHSTVVDAGAWCGVSVGWDDAMVVSNGIWTVQYDEASTGVEIDENPEAVSAALTPFTVVSGSFSGIAPRLYVTVQE